MKRPCLMIVVPCYNEEEVLEETTGQLIAELDKLRMENLIAPASKILYVDDGSQDQTWTLIRRLHLRNPQVCGLSIGPAISWNRICGKTSARTAIDLSL